MLELEKVLIIHRNVREDWALDAQQIMQNGGVKSTGILWISS